MAEVIIYRKYPFKTDEQDPVLADVGEVLEKEGLSKKPKIVQELSGVSRSTLHNWASGKTRFPRYATVAAVFAAFGFHLVHKRAEKFDLEAERADAKRWNIRQQAAKLAAKTGRRSRRNGNGKDNRASL